MMRQANFPDQKALTARDETNSKPSQQSWAGSSVTVGTSVSLSSWSQRRHWAGNGPFPQSSLRAHTGHPHHCFGQCVEGSSGLVQSSTSQCEAPKWPIHTCHFSLSHLPHVPMKWPWLHFPDFFLHRLWSGQKPIEPISSEPNSFLACLPGPLEHLHCWPCVGTWGDVQGVRRLHSESTEPTAWWGWARASPFHVHHPPPPPSWILKFSVHFLKWQVFYPTLHKIKHILYTGEDR